METPETSPARIEELQAEWTDQFVRVNQARPELRRFGETVGRVVTVNFNAKAVVDFQDGGWYDIAASEDCLKKLDAAAAAKYKNTNSAQVIPDKQG
jgi:hypothetical protein